MKGYLRSRKGFLKILLTFCQWGILGREREMDDAGELGGSPYWLKPRPGRKPLPHSALVFDRNAPQGKVIIFISTFMILGKTLLSLEVHFRKVKLCNLNPRSVVFLFWMKTEKDVHVFRNKESSSKQ